MGFSSLYLLITIVALISLVVGVYYWLKDKILAKQKEKAQDEYISALTKVQDEVRKIDIVDIDSPIDDRLSKVKYRD